MSFDRSVLMPGCVSKLFWYPQSRVVVGGGLQPLHMPTTIRKPNSSLAMTLRGIGLLWKLVGLDMWNFGAWKSFYHWWCLDGIEPWLSMRSRRRPPCRQETWLGEATGQLPCGGCLRNRKRNLGWPGCPVIKVAWAIISLTGSVLH
jgi:hypothetical protein